MSENRQIELLVDRNYIEEDRIGDRVIDATKTDFELWKTNNNVELIVTSRGMVYSPRIWVFGGTPAPFYKPYKQYDEEHVLYDAPLYLRHMSDDDRKRYRERAHIKHAAIVNRMVVAVDCYGATYCARIRKEQIDVEYIPPVIETSVSCLTKNTSLAEVTVHYTRHKSILKYERKFYCNSLVRPHVHHSAHRCYNVYYAFYKPLAWSIENHRDRPRRIREEIEMICTLCLDLPVHLIVEVVKYSQ